MEKPRLRGENVEGHEYTPSIEAVSSFLNLPGGSLETFRDRLAGAQGHLRIWVHPLYTKQWPASIQGSRLGDVDLADVQKKLRTKFFKTVESVVKNQSSSPLIVYEAFNKIEGTRALIAEQLDSETNELEDLGIVFVPTEAGSSSLDQSHFIKSLQSGNEADKREAAKLIINKEAVDSFVELSNKQLMEIHQQIPGFAEDPYYSMSEEERSLYLKLNEQHYKQRQSVMEEYRNARESWILESEQFIIFIYRSLGLKSTLISGAYLEVGEDYKTNEPKLVACAGAVVNTLRAAGFPTDISNNIWPPKDLIRAAGFEVKQTSAAQHRE